MFPYLLLLCYINGASTRRTERPSLRGMEMFLHSSRVISWLICWVFKKSSRTSVTQDALYIPVSYTHLLQSSLSNMFDKPTFQRFYVWQQFSPFLPDKRSICHSILFSVAKKCEHFYHLLEQKKKSEGRRLSVPAACINPARSKQCCPLSHRR